MPSHPLGHPCLPSFDSREPMPLPFLATLNISDLYKLTNDPINHSLLWNLIPHYIPTYIPMFAVKQGYDTETHVTTYHLFYVSNSMIEDSIYTKHFPHTLTINATKWEIELP